MPVPKRRHSKGRTRRKRLNKMQADVVKVIEVEKNIYKRPHVEEKIEIK